MKKRSPIVVALLSLITGGIYSLYWLIVTKEELNAKGAKIPTAWMIAATIIPVVGPFVVLFWLWKYTEGAEQVTNGKVSGILGFILLALIFFVGVAVIQDAYNKLGEIADAPVAPSTVPASVPAETSASATSAPAPTEAPVAAPATPTDQQPTQTPGA